MYDARVPGPITVLGSCGPTVILSMLGQKASRDLGFAPIRPNASGRSQLPGTGLHTYHAGERRFVAFPVIRRSNCTTSFWIIS